MNATTAFVAGMVSGSLVILAGVIWHIRSMAETPDDSDEAGA